MTAVSYPIYDADRHFYEPPEAFLRHLPKQHRRAFQYVQVNGRTKLAVDGVLSDYIPNPGFEVVAAPGSHEKWYRGQNPQGLSLREMGGEPVRTEAAFHNGEAHLKVMDAQGIHAGLVLPTLASVIEARLEHKPDAMAALFHALNRWTVEECGLAYKGRLFPVSMVNLADIDSGVKELEYLLANGSRVVGIRPAPVSGTNGRRPLGGGPRSTACSACAAGGLASGWTGAGPAAWRGGSSSSSSFAPVTAASSRAALRPSSNVASMVWCPAWR